MRFVTLVLAVIQPETIWLLANRRLSSKGRPPKDDGLKMVSLDTTDGRAILAYAGLGATALGTEPAGWMAAVLRGKNLPLEQSLGVLAGEMQRQLPRHLRQMPANSVAAHHVIVPAFLGTELRLYSIELALTPDRKSYNFQYTRHVRPKPVSPGPPPLGLGGTGGFHLMRDTKWARSVLRAVKAHDSRKLPALEVADHLATLNNKVHLDMADGSVGPRCVVVWRYRKDGVHGGGGGQQYYTGTQRDADNPSLP
ncbi:MAG TPA: hypothetical protein VLE70_02145, partial [Anaerolineae bacterium]|nr:hypothetical protein [Anaerolineae bacterium]